jgi:hypothetical protein
MPSIGPRGRETRRPGIDAHDLDHRLRFVVDQAEELQRQVGGIKQVAADLLSLIAERRGERNHRPALAGLPPITRRPEPRDHHQ